jgi:4'-phosphopantetheinyl transferase
MTDWPIASLDRDPPPTDTIRCWRVLVDQIDPATEFDLRSVMDDGERMRASRFLHASDRRSFAAAHAGLRLVLAAALGAKCHEFRFGSGLFGKPVLEDGAVEFNLSHSGGVVLIALAKELAIGADVEQIRPLPDRHAIVNNYLHRSEAADLNALPEAEAGLAFFRCWARKEAVTKALGLGLSLPLDRYRVSCRPDMPPELLALEGDDQTASWSIIDIDPSPSSILTHFGALAARAKPLEVSCRTLDLEDALASSQLYSTG